MGLGRLAHLQSSGDHLTGNGPTLDHFRQALNGFHARIGGLPLRKRLALTFVSQIALVEQIGNSSLRFSPHQFQFGSLPACQFVRGCLIMAKELVPGSSETTPTNSKP